MIVNLEANGEEFAKQVMRVRRQLNPIVAANDDGDPMAVLGAAEARLMVASFIPFLTALRAEIMAMGHKLPHDKVAYLVEEAVANLAANIALTAIHTLYDAQPYQMGAQIETVLIRACEIACKKIAEGAAAQQEAKTKAIFSVIEGGRSDVATKTAIHDQRSGEGESDG